MVLALAVLGTAAPALMDRDDLRRPAGLGVTLPAAPPEPPPVGRPGDASAGTVPVRCRAGPACVRWRLPPATDGAASPTLAADHLVVPTAAGLRGFRTTTGAEEWRTELGDPGAGAPTVAAVAGAERYVVVADAEGRLTALDSSDGTLRWQAPMEGLVEIRSAQAVAGGWLVAARARGTDGVTSFVAVVRLDADTGAIRWRHEAANALLSPAGAILQDVNGTLTGVATDGAEAWELVTDRPAASLSDVGALALVGTRDHALIVDVVSGSVLDEISGSPSQVRADEGAVVWPVAGGVGYRSADGVGWRADVPEAAGCCSGFLRDATSVTVLTGRGEMIRLSAVDGTLMDRRRAPPSLGAGDGRAWLYGRIALATIPGSGGVARLHDAVGGDHLADITAEAYALLAAERNRWIVLAPGYALTLSLDVTAGDAEGRPRGSALLR